MNLIDNFKNITVNIDGKWVIARPIPNMSITYRIKAAWNVLIGKAEAVTFYKQ
ncbi:MAG: hypothetical protein H6Q67_1485 [Firmicutes bacterium]|nr:hypothetical protein [Bacillota bacterium]